MQSSTSLDLLPEDASHHDCPTLLDVNTIESLLNWLDANPPFAARLKDGRWNIVALERHVERRANWQKLKQRLKRYRIDLKIHVFDARDDLFLREIRRAYFLNDPDADAQVELLAFGRSIADQNIPLRIISRHRSFSLIPQVERFFVPSVLDIGNDNVSAFLRAIEPLDLHRDVRRFAFERITHNDNVVAIDQAVKALIEYIRDIGDEAGHTYVSNKNDRPMVDQALRSSYFSGQIVKCDPQIKLNNYSDPSEESEQQGYRDIIHGVVGAVRNPLAHNVADMPFLQSRFSDRRTALKFLCMLSLLFEKLDKRVSP